MDPWTQAYLAVQCSDSEGLILNPLRPAWGTCDCGASLHLSPPEKLVGASREEQRRLSRVTLFTSVGQSSKFTFRRHVTIISVLQTPAQRRPRKGLLNTSHQGPRPSRLNLEIKLRQPHQTVARPKGFFRSDALIG